MAKKIILLLLFSMSIVASSYAVWNSPKLIIIIVNKPSDRHVYTLAPLTERLCYPSLCTDHLTGEPAGSGRSSRLDLRSTHPVDNTRQRAMSTDEQSGTRGPVWVSAAGRKIAGGDDRGRQAGDKERQTKKTTSKTSAASRKKPSRLLSQTKKESHDSHMTTKKALRDGHVISNRPQSRAPQLGRDQQRLPPVYTYSSRE